MKVLALVAAMFLGACSAGAPTGTPATPPGTTAITPSPSVPPSAHPPTSPSDAPASTAAAWGPLAVLPAADGMDTAAAGGTLRITEDCVYLDVTGRAYLLLWHADQVAWDAAMRTITFENFPQNGAVVTLRDGDEIVVGGSGGGEAESDRTGEDIVAQLDWVAPPASSCALNPWWSVGAVQS